MIEVQSNAYEMVDSLDFSSPQAFYESYVNAVGNSFNGVSGIGGDAGAAIYAFYEKISTPLHDNVMNILGGF